MFAVSTNEQARKNYDRIFSKKNKSEEVEDPNYDQSDSSLQAEAESTPKRRGRPAGSGAKKQVDETNPF